MNKPNELLDALTHEGVLITVSVRYWRANKKLSAEDLGLQPGAVTDQLISLGHKRLLPKEALRGFGLIESRVHGLIESSTFSFLNGLAHFLPNNKLEGVMTTLRRLESEFDRTKRVFLESYDTLRDESLKEWRAAAIRLGQEPTGLVEAIAASFPTEQRLEKRFCFSVQLFQISLPENAERRLIEAEDQRQVIQARDALAAKASEAMQRELDLFVSDCVTTMREQTAALCEEMLASMQTGTKGVHQKTLNRLIRFIDEFKQLNFVGDQQMEEELERVRQQFLLRSAESYRGDNAAQERLKNGLRGLAESARGLMEQGGQELVDRFGRMGHRRILKVA